MMATDNSKPRWFFYLAWVALGGIGIPIAFALYRAIISLVEGVVGSTMVVGGQPRITQDFLLPYILGPALGLVTGLLQSLLLRRHLPRIGWWIIATVLGWCLGLAGGGVLRRILSGLPAIRAVWFEILMTTLAGGAMGVAQWLVMHRRVRRAAWWILANVLGWGAVGWGAATLSTQVVLLAAGILLVPGLATSIALWFLLDRLPKGEGSGREPLPSSVVEGTA